MTIGVPNDGAQSSPANELQRHKEFCRFRGFQSSSRTSRMYPRPPEDFVGHPVSDPGKRFLHQENGLQRGSAPALEKTRKARAIKLRIEYFRRPVAPPTRFTRAGFEIHTPKHPGSTKNQRPLFLAQNKVIVPSRRERSRFDQQFAGHAKMQTQPSGATEGECELLAAPKPVPQSGAFQLRESRRVAIAKNARRRVRLDRKNKPTVSGSPSTAHVFHFGQFRHVFFGGMRRE
jgi:hypothetical protein